MKVISVPRSIPWKRTFIILALLILFFGGTFTRFYTDWLWFKEDIGKPELFWTIIKARQGLFWTAFAAFTLFAALNWMKAFKRALDTTPTVRRKRKTIVEQLKEGRVEAFDWENIGSFQRLIPYFVWGGAIISGMFFASATASRSLDWLLFLNDVPVGTVDPVFKRDLGFYFFKLGFLQFAVKLLLIGVLVVGVVTALIYSSDRLADRLERLDEKGAAHLLQLASLGTLLLAAYFWLSRFDYLTARGDVLTGASYTDMHAGLPILTFLAWALALIGLGTLAFIRRKNGMSAWFGMLILWGGCYLLGMWLYPSLIEATTVRPNQLQKESFYIARNIAGTRAAYSLNNIETRNAPYKPEPNAQELTANRDTLDNMRVWDPRVLDETYNNTQAIRLYYRFREGSQSLSDDNGIDVGRYFIDGKPRITMLAARELNLEGLPSSAQTWQTTRLQYTHGYGLAMNLVNAATPEGNPIFIIQNIPPSTPKGLEVTQPGIYFGESSAEPVLVNSRVPELDYPSDNSEQAQYTSYQGKTGIQIGARGAFARLMYALRLGDSNLMLSGAITPQTRLLFHRNIVERAKLVYPYLQLDHDPYLAIADGKLFWLIDAYTTSSRYPYSSAFAGQDEAPINYIRNSVKIAINAYDGSIQGYISDETDPLIQAYKRIFPTAFKPLDQMSPALRQHVRYPERLFLIQSAMYRFYHITDTRAFYQKEDAWEFPNENLEVNTKVQMRPYYVQMQLPSESASSYNLILPFTPLRRQNLVSWLAASCEPATYGKLIVYRYPEQLNVPGPETVYAYLQQNPAISSQMTLWNSQTGGSKALFGNMIVAPIGSSLLYVQPVYLRADKQGGQSVPTLTAVMVGVGSRTTIGKNFEDALRNLFAQNRPPEPGATTPQPAAPSTPKELIRQANEAFTQAQTAQRSGDWAEYGRQIKRLEELLKQLQNASGQ